MIQSELYRFVSNKRRIFEYVLDNHKKGCVFLHPNNIILYLGESALEEKIVYVYQKPGKINVLKKMALFDNKKIIIDKESESFFEKVQ